MGRYAKEVRTLEERRKTVRRQADRELVQTVEELQGKLARLGDAGAREAKRRRRHAIRHNCKAAIEMRIGHSAGFGDTWSLDTIKVNGRVLDLSDTGASLFTKQSFETGQELQLAIALRGGSKINAKGSVRWIKAVPEKSGYLSGVEFGDVSEKEQKKIAKFLKKLEDTAGL